MCAIATKTLLCVTVHNVKPLRSFKGNLTKQFLILAQFLTLNISLIPNSLLTIYHSLPIVNAAVGKYAYFAMLNEWNSTRTLTIFIQK
jgi:hypothetical protein